MMALVSQAWQSWKSAKAVAFVIVVAFTVGIGSATAIYTVINSLLLRPLPYQHGERFVSLLGASLDDPNGRSSLNISDVLEYQKRARSFDVFGWFQFANYNLTAPGQPQYINGVDVTPPLVNKLGVNPRFGQWFRDADAPVAVISHPLWQRLGADPGMVGKTITLNGHIYTVTGVMPPGFNLPIAGYYSTAQIDVWLPLDPAGRGQVSGQGINFCYARLRPGVTAAQADAEVKRIAAEIARREPASHPSYTARVDGLQALITREIKPILLLLFAAAELLLLITCANVGGLLLARSVARARETAVRVALGAGMGRLALQYFVEGLFVSLPGAVGGLLFSAALLRALVSFAAQAVPLANGMAMDWRVLAFALGTAFVACALSGMAPLWQAARTLPNEVLSEGVRASAGARTRWLSRSLVVAEIALAFVLLAVSAVLGSELYRITRVRPGFEPDHLLTFHLTFAADAVPGGPRRVAYSNRLVQAMEAIPGVSGVSFVNHLPLHCCYSASIFPEGSSVNPTNGETVNLLVAHPGYIRTMQIPLRRGRFLTEHDTNETLLPVVIDEATARRYWPKQDPVGAFGHFSLPTGNRFQVIGVVGDVKNNGLDRPTVPEVYLPSAIVAVNPLNFVVRSPLPVGTLVPAVRRAIQNVNAEQPIHEVKMMSEIVQESVALKRLASYMMVFFAFAAVLMATIGTYGVVSYSVRQRTVEIGTRMALGAVSRDLLYLVVGSGLKMAAYGVALGGIASIAAVWLLARELEIKNPGFLPFVLSAATVAIIAMASSFFPAWRATLLSPMVAIRNEPGSMWELFANFSRAVSRSNDAPIASGGTLMTELIDASRGAASFREAIRAALEALRVNIGAQSAQVLEAVSSEEYRATTAVPDQGPACSIPRRGLLLNRLWAYAAPLPISSGDIDTWLRWAAEYKPESVAEIETLQSTGTRLAVPLRTNKEVLGVLLLGAPEGREQYSQAEKQLLRGCADQFALLLENARLTGRVMEQEKVLRDVALAAEVQKRLLPRQSLETVVASLTGLNLPARSVGGDYFDFLELDGDRTGIALADVAGKGIAAALIMSVVQASLRVIAAERDLSLPQLAAKMNYFLYRSTGPNSYATFFYAQLDQRNRQLRYVNAGHNAPYLLRSGLDSMDVEELSTGGTIIGMFPQALYEEGTIDLRPGDVLIVFTDGVTEALNPSDEEFGEERLKDLFRQVFHLPVEEMSARISQELKSWIQDAAQYDDLTFLLVKMK
jgi:putative ABC transport system permease protein